MTSFLHTSDPETHLQRQSHFCPGHQSFINYSDFPAFGLLPLPDLDITPSCLALDGSSYQYSHQGDPMHPDSWGPAGPSTSKLGRLSHHRESSFSSLGSSGPVSPFQQHLPTPQISISDTSEDAIMDMHSHDMNMSHSGGAPFYHHQFAKPFESYQPFQNLDNAAVTEMAYPVTIPGPTSKHQRPRVDRSLLPAPDFVTGSSRSHPTSVASSIAGDSPATPTVGETDPMERRRPGHNAPKLDRTMTDVYGDELYSPNFTITSSSPSHAANVAALPNNNDVFNQRLSAANSQHLSTSHQSPSSTLSRDMTPFRNGNSPLTPTAPQDWMHKANVGFNSAQRIREQNKAQQDARVVQQQQQQRKVDSRTPQTISPKDAMLEFNEADEEAQFPLFPQSTSDWAIEQLTGAISGVNTFGSNAQINYGHSQGPSTAQVPQQYPFVSQQRTIQQTPVQRTGSGESSSTRASNQSPEQGRPVNAGTDGGTYTCTYHGCTLRFETPSLLQRHKREGHRQTHTLGGCLRHQDASSASGLFNSQAGPHQCTRINPSTGKPCMTIFSRPYDLTRHEDTIHNARKQKVHCNICTEDKTFSRADALTRHYRVCHPDMELPGKHRRRGGS